MHLHPARIELHQLYSPAMIDLFGATDKCGAYALRHVFAAPQTITARKWHETSAYSLLHKQSQEGTHAQRQIAIVGFNMHVSRRSDLRIS